MRGRRAKGERLLQGQGPQRHLGGSEGQEKVLGGCHPGRHRHLGRLGVVAASGDGEGIVPRLEPVAVGAGPPVGLEGPAWAAAAGLDQDIGLHRPARTIVGDRAGNLAHRRPRHHRHMHGHVEARIDLASGSGPHVEFAVKVAGLVDARSRGRVELAQDGQAAPGRDGAAAHVGAVPGRRHWIAQEPEHGRIDDGGLVGVARLARAEAVQVKAEIDGPVAGPLGADPAIVAARGLKDANALGTGERVVDDDHRTDVGGEAGHDVQADLRSGPLLEPVEIGLEIDPVQAAVLVVQCKAAIRQEEAAARVEVGNDVVMLWAQVCGAGIDDGGIVEQFGDADVEESRGVDADVIVPEVLKGHLKGDGVFLEVLVVHE